MLADNHFAFLILAIPPDRVLFCGEASSVAVGAADLDRLADAAVRVFLAAYGDQVVRERGPGDEPVVRERYEGISFVGKPAAGPRAVISACYKLPALAA